MVFRGDGRLKFCKTCGLLDVVQNVCRLYKKIVNPEADYCSEYNENPQACDYCQRYVPNEALNIVFNGDKTHFMCPRCASAINTCNFCEELNYCDFETNPSSVPKIIKQEIRQGNFISVQTVKNIERIRLTCQNGCKCWSEDFGCMKEFGYCDNICSVYKHLNEQF